MQLPRKLSGLLGIGLAVYIAIIASDSRVGYYTYELCDYPGRAVDQSVRCNYDIIKKSERRGFLGLGSDTSFEIYKDIDLDGVADGLDKEGNEIFFRFGYDSQFRPQFTTGDKGNPIVVYPAPLPRGSREPDNVGNIDVIWTSEQEMEIDRRFQDILSYLPSDYPYLAALREKQ